MHYRNQTINLENWGGLHTETQKAMALGKQKQSLKVQESVAEANVVVTQDLDERRAALVVSSLSKAVGPGTLRHTDGLPDTY